VAEVPVKLVGIRAGGLLILRCGNEATRGSGGAAHRNGLGTSHSKGAAVVVEEDATMMTKFFFVRVIAKGPRAHARMRPRAACTGHGRLHTPVHGP
jgi:hypothetical protein